MAKKAHFSVACTAVYHSELIIPDYVEEGEELDYIREHLDEANVEDLTWLSDLDPEDAVTEEDIRYIEDIEPEEELEM